MKIVLTKKEFEDMALSVLKAKYDKFLPTDEQAIVTQRYDGIVEIEFEKMITTENG